MPFLGVLLASAIFPPTMLVIAIGLIPSMVAWFVDRSREKAQAITVGAMNICGLLPVLMQLWRGDHSMQQAMELVGSPFSWLFIMCGTAIGWGIFFAVPPVIAAGTKMTMESRVDRLEKRRKAMIEEWGEEVTGVTEDDDEQGNSAPRRPDLPVAPVRDD
ncbi:MAG: hypothetical protein Alpg2KO_28180 [Alphaproteobacteria bacterium]